MKQFLGAIAISILFSGVALIGYHRMVVSPALTVGVVDIAGIYRDKEAEFAKVITSGAPEAERQVALARAREFAQRLPGALDEISAECGCLVMLKSAVASMNPRTVDLTGFLKSRLDKR